MRSITQKFLLSLFVLCLIPAMAFASGQAEASGSGEAESQMNEGADVKMTTVDFVQVAWLDIEATTATTRLVLEALGYDTTSVTVAVPIAYEGMASGDADVFLGNWMPSMATIADQYFEDGTVEQYAVNLEGAKYTLAVPTYMAEQGLQDFSDIADFGEELEYNIHGIEAGNDGNQLIQQMIDENAFGLEDFNVVDSSEAGMLSEVRGRAPEEIPIVFLGWEPHPMNANIDMTYLTGGDDYFGPNLGAATVYTNVRTGYAEEFPNLGQFFSNLKFTLELENEVMTSISDGMNARDAAREWLQENPEILSTWLDGVYTVDGQPGLPAVREELGI